MSCGSIFYILTPVLGPVLRFIYNVVNNYGLAIIIFSIVVKLLTFPLSIKQYKSTLAMKKIQPELTKLQKKYANDKEKLQKEQMDLYSKYDINPAAGCLPLLIQMPILFALYRVIMLPLTYIAGIADDTVSKISEVLGLAEGGTNAVMQSQIKMAEMLNNPDNLAKVADLVPDFKGIDFNFLGLNLAETPEFGFTTISVLWIIPVLAGLTSYLSMYVSNKTSGMSEEQASQMKGMSYVMPFMSVYFCFILPCGMGIYWIINNVIAIVQQVVLTKFLGKGDDDVIEVKPEKKKKKK